MQQITEMLKENEEQRKCKFQDMEKRPEVMFDEVLRRNTQLLREKEQKELLSKQHMKRCNPSSKPQRKIDKALRRNAPLLNEKEQKEAVYQQIVCKLQVSEKNNEDLRVMFEEDKSQKDMKSLLQELQQRHEALQTIH